MIDGFSPAGEMPLLLHRRIYNAAATKIVMHAIGTATLMAIMASVDSPFDMVLDETEDEVV